MLKKTSLDYRIIQFIDSVCATFCSNKWIERQGCGREMKSIKDSWDGYYWGVNESIGSIKPGSIKVARGCEFYASDHMVTHDPRGQVYTDLRGNKNNNQYTIQNVICICRKYPAFG